jgi:hypothetical protein
MLGTVLQVGAPKAALPTLMQRTDGHQHGTHHRPLPIHTLQVAGRPQPGTQHLGHLIPMRKVEDKHPHGMLKLVRLILIVAVAAGQVDGAVLHRKRAGDGEMALGVDLVDRHPFGVVKQAVW